MNPPLPYPDIHTHRPDAPAGSVICLDPTDAMPELRHDAVYSAGIHPWNADKADDGAWQRLGTLARNPQIVAIGEAGLDTLRGPSLRMQLPVFARQARLAEAVGKPLVIHAVRAWEPLLRLHAELKPSVTWIVHGFRGKPELARQLTSHGIHLSLGERFHPDVPATVPPHMIHHETDQEP